jgi:sulfate permease, SulP family
MRMSEYATKGARDERADDPPRADRVVHRLEGPFFFGAAARLGGALDQSAKAPKVLVLEMTGVPFIDSSGAHSLHSLAARMRLQGRQLYLVGLGDPLRHQLEGQGLQEPLVRYLGSISAVDRMLDGAQAAVESP